MLPYILNLFDLVCTYHFLNQGGNELNPVVRKLLDTHPALFPFCKIVLAGALFYFLYRESKIDLAGRIAYWIVTGYYSLIAVYYVVLIIWSAVL